MLYQISDGSVSVGGSTVLSHIDFEIKGSERIAVVGRNGAGKSTLLKLIAGELDLDRDDKRKGNGIVTSRKLTIGMLGQQGIGNQDRTVEEELLEGCPCKDTFDPERFRYEQEYDRLFTGFGFAKADKKRRLSEFSGGEQTKIGFIRLLLMKPDILLLDEPTNHLDIQTTEWLEQYLQTYEHAVVMVSHDRFFLDRTAEVVYEVSGQKLYRYPGNYTNYRKEKRKNLELQKKAYDRQREELERLEEVIERFKHKPAKASFARAKKKQIQRMMLVEKPEFDDVHLFTGDINPLVLGGKWVFQAEHLRIGYEKALFEISIRIRRGQKIGILGGNGVGKSTFLKTVAGLIPPFCGKEEDESSTALLEKYSFGNQVTIGYFDQHSAEIQSEKSVAEHFHDLFPAMTEKDVRNTLGAYLFDGRAASQKVSSLSGGEKARLVLAELLQSRPNFLLLDEPTNHMDIQAKETLESAFQAYKGTILFVSHDRYFIRQVADAVLIFEGESVLYYPFGYEHYLERLEREISGETIAARIRAEDAALIAGMRAVPKAERHRLREISTGEAYLDWKLRLVMEKLEPAGRAYEKQEQECKELKENWLMSQMKALGDQAEERQAEGDKELYEAACRKRDEVWKVWNECCLEWMEVWEEETL